jgi:outer membrane protein assembly factor BamD
MKIKVLPLILVILATLTSCSDYSRMLKSRDMDAKSDYAIKLYNKGEYFKALPLFEELITVYRGTKKAEQTYYYYSYTNYRIGDFETAAYDFDNFTKTYPSSEFAEECAFMHAYCYYQGSPEYSLDQTNTYKAINELQLFIDRYPDSKKVEECNKLIDQLREKLEQKEFENAELYFNMTTYKAAITTYKNLIHDFPSTKYREEAMYMILRSNFLLAENSIVTKMQERYSDTVTAYGEFNSAYPDSKYKNKADDILETSRKRLEKISKEQVQVQ